MRGAWRGCAVGVALAGLIAPSGCGDADPRTSAVASPSLTPATKTAVAASNDAAPDDGAPVELTLEQLRTRVLDAVRAETSVHMAMGNLNPPPTSEVDQDYSKPDGDLEAVFATEPGRPPVFDARRVDGEVYMSAEGKPFEHITAQKMSEAEGTPLIALFRTDVVKDFTSIFAATMKADFTGADPSIGAGVACYRLEVDTSAWFGTQGGDVALGVPRHAGLRKKIPARLCVGSTGLPVLVEVKYSEPLNGIAGTGTTRVDYSRWSDPIEVERPAS
jgi:hypothetical protein